MKLFIFTIEPQSGFGTALKGDTLFGHYCWQACYDSSLLADSIENVLGYYDRRPFAVFSSAVPRLTSESLLFAIKRPDLPPHMLMPTPSKRLEGILAAKDNKKKKWLPVARDLCVDCKSKRFLTDAELMEAAWSSGASLAKSPFIDTVRAHNTINRFTGTTGPAPFAPYETGCLFYAPGFRLAVLVALDPDITNVELIDKGLQRIGQTGYGRDASTGCGRFKVNNVEELAMPDWNRTRALYTMGPSVVPRGFFKRFYCKPFVRFGRHGDRLANSSNPFKNPVIMADEGAVGIAPAISDGFEGIIGSAVKEISKVQPQAVAQGYTFCLPLELATSSIPED